MNKEINDAINNLYDVLRKTSSNDLVSVNIFFNSYGIDITTQQKTAEQLKSSGIAMKNIRGEWIK